MAHLDRQGDVFVLVLGEGENRFNPASVKALGALLDEVEASPPPRALVTTAVGKIWSNGLDLEWMSAHTAEINPLLVSVHELLARVLAAGVPTVAALQGHAFAAGAMLALAHDERVMRADRGYFCLPEVDIKIPFSPGMSALISARLSARTAHEAMTTGRRYGGIEAEQAGIVKDAVPDSEVVSRAIELAGALAAKDPATLSTIKQRLYANMLAALRDSDANTLPLPPQ
ncbi:MAG: enoyl-CoA hydratase/isomerase family protein [Solirubrobacteraceae bacterium]|jgi:Delta3-Delta2-enoyl-CoA isomerase